MDCRNDMGTISRGYTKAKWLSADCGASNRFWVLVEFCRRVPPVQELR
jgi:hypothetical protein